MWPELRGGCAGHRIRFTCCFPARGTLGAHAPRVQPLERNPMQDILDRAALAALEAGAVPQSQAEMTP